MIVSAELERGWKVDNSGIFGQWYFNDRRFCLTKELLWRDNKKNVSCFPDGVYKCRVVRHPHWGFVIWITDIPGRSGGLVHFGSYLNDTKGCILIGNGIELPRDRDSEILLTGTKDTFKTMMHYLKKNNIQEFYLEISSPWKLTVDRGDI